MGPGFIERISRNAPPEVLAQLAEHIASRTMQRIGERIYVGAQALAHVGANPAGVVIALEVAQNLNAVLHLPENPPGMTMLICADALVGISMRIVENGGLSARGLELLKSAIAAFNARAETPLN